LTEKFKALSPPIGLVPLSGLVEEMREVKDALEVKALEASAELISTILDEVIAGLEPGLTEKEVAWQIECMAHEAGAERLAFPPIVASGPNSALPHALPTDRRLGKEEPIILDAGVRLRGYCSDITRTIFLGRPGPDLRKIYNTVRQAQLAALEEIRPGVDSIHPDAIARDVIRDAEFGEYFGHALGHGVGLATHERPRLGPQKPVKLKKGMVVTVEPGIYIPGKAGVRLEEMVVIETDGPRILTKADHLYDFPS
jgi:Xaa-Pro aminopeptidase